ncbi:MAG: lipoprotein signal peptidase [Muribaculaceae bacterium]|jgi:signal peptidase II|nr:lipoprotein signal peptidase [Muribaculaceae bacterium]CCX47073.1 lipoprotein signal peptidase [Bacteroides sp. CAG:927]
MKQHKGLLALGVILLVIILDQALKIWIKTHFYLGEEYVITSWFRLYFIENNGMAFGMELGSKLFLSVFRIFLAIGLIWYLWKLRTNTTVKTGYVVCVALITAGAIGNIIDCMLYGLIFNNPIPPQVATLFPPEGGYATLFHGRVVDMLYFPLFSFTWPQWMPWVGGEHFLFFQPVFNLADAAISVGIILVLLFYTRFLAEPTLKAPEADSETPSDTDE